MTIDDGNGGRATQTITITLVGEKQPGQTSRRFIFPCDFKFDPPPKYPEFNLHGFDGLPQEHFGNLPYMPFVAFSGWLPHDGSNVNTRSTDPIPDDDGGYCPLPSPFTPWVHSPNSSHFTPDDHPVAS